MGCKESNKQTNKILFAFQGYRFVGTSRGKILMMDLNKGLVPIELNITNPPSAPNFMASPHGISIWKDEKTGIQLVL